MSAQLTFSIWTHRWTQNLLWLLSDTSIGNIQTDYGVRSNVCSIFLWAKITPHYHVCTNSKYNRCHGWSMSNIIMGLKTHLLLLWMVLLVSLNATEYNSNHMNNEWAWELYFIPSWFISEWMSRSIRTVSLYAQFLST